MGRADGERGGGEGRWGAVGCWNSRECSLSAGEVIRIIKGAVEERAVDAGR